MEHFQFYHRHLGIHTKDLATMLEAIGVSSIEQLLYETIPDNIRLGRNLNLAPAMSEAEYLAYAKASGEKNHSFRSFIGQGFYGTYTPSVILRNLFHNPGWYTQYTPYQAEIAQGRLEALLNFQTMVSDLTGMPLANASLLDEGTAVAEAMSMVYNIHNKRVRKDEDLVRKIFVDQKVYRHTNEVLVSRGQPIGIEIERGNWNEISLDGSYFAVVLQYPNSDGEIEDYRSWVHECEKKGIYVIVAADLLSLTLLVPPGEWGADVVVGTSQRFGIPMGGGGPHAAFFACKEKFKRQLPGRIIGVSRDIDDNVVYRMALQTREQHIRREKATSNICTAQALLAIMAGMYGVYHGPDHLRSIATRVAKRTRQLMNGLQSLGFETLNQYFFDTISIGAEAELSARIKELAEAKNMNFYFEEGKVSISLDETTRPADVDDILDVFRQISQKDDNGERQNSTSDVWHIHPDLKRESPFMQHPVFNSYHTETEMMRYLKSLENKDLSLVHSMIPLGSCTMKLNAATQLIPVSFQSFADAHPFTPSWQMEGYSQIVQELGKALCEMTGFDACSFMPNSGAQGELTGLLVIRAYHAERNESYRNVALIPSSAHGTNPASAVMAGMKVVVVACNDQGDIDVQDLKAKLDEHSGNVGALMVTYPSTHGVFELAIRDICELVHEAGGLVYMDGANMNAQVGYTSPGFIGADVCHLNLHKTFSIPHGGGGPGMGPICVNSKLEPYLPRHSAMPTGGEKGIPAVGSTPYGSASLLLISHAYIRMLGVKGVKMATSVAILNANYIKSRLENEYDILYTGEHGRCAHELIIDLRPFREYGVSAEDVAKRLIDYGFHAPTLSFPVSGTIMIEPTESESMAELDRFVEAMQAIRLEIEEVATGAYDADNNVLSNSPHPLYKVCGDEWDYPYSRKKAAFPLEWLRYEHKFWVNVGRIDNAYGDRHLMCTCPPIEAYSDEVEK